MASKGSAAAASHSRLGEVAWGKMDKIVRFIIIVFILMCVGRIHAFCGFSFELLPPSSAGLTALAERRVVHDDVRRDRRSNAQRL